MQMKITCFFFFVLLQTVIYGQVVSETFMSTRVINGHSVETLKKRYFEYRIEHRFGDFAGSGGGATQGFGFDNAADIRFAFEYGLNDRLMIGLGRNKGSTNAYRNVLDGFVKYRLMQQEEKGKPISMTVVASSLYCYNKATSDLQSILSFPKFSHRFAYTVQLNIARKLTQRISLAVMPTYVHRNYVAYTDLNDLLAIGAGINFKLSKTWGLMAEYYQALHNDDVRTQYTSSFAIGTEWCTNGHNFHFGLSNSGLFNEAQFITYTTEKWSKGQYRIGFSITRNFKR